jgi:hypothetical protein
MDIIAYRNVPKQRLSTSKKNDKWVKEIIEYYTNTILMETESVRKRKLDVNENYNLVVGKLDRYRLARTFNPMKLEGEQVVIPTEDEVISIIKPALKTLIGEEYARPFEFKVFMTNPDAISEKEESIQSAILGRLSDLVMKPGLTEEEAQVKMESIQRWKKYSAQDIRERAATHLLNHYYTMLDLRRVFNKGWKDVLVAGEEIYRISDINGNPIVKRCNPLDIYTLRSGDSQYIEDSDVIIEDTYMAPGMIVDEFYDYLSDADMKWIYSEDEYAYNSSINSAVPVRQSAVDSDTLIEIDYRTNVPLTTRTKIFRTKEGNIRVMRVYWRSLREVGFLTYFDEVTGEQRERVVDENYIVNKDAGETVEWKWITEWWQGVRIGQDIYIDGKPCEVQRRDMNNVSISKPPFVGTAYNYNDREAQSLLDELKPIQYEWIVFSKKVSLLWSRNYGKLVKIDVSKIPDDFDLDLFMTWIQSFGIIVEDPFKEGAKGQQSGLYQSSVSSVDLELSSSIQAALSYMMYLRELAEEITGVSRQRKGELLATDGLGTTQAAIYGSSKLTEELFEEHEYTKQRVLEALLETAKFSLRNRRNKKLQYILDDLSFAVYDLDIEGFTDASYGLKVASSSKQSQLEQQMQTLAQAALQAGTLMFSQYMDISNVNSLSDKINRLKSYEEEQQLRAQKQQEGDQQMQQEQLKMQMQENQVQRDHELKLKQLEWQMKMQIEQMKIQAGAYQQFTAMTNDTNNNGIKDEVELERQQMTIAQQDKTLTFQKNKWQDEKKLKEQKLKIDEKKATITAKNKSKTTKK